MMKRRRFIRKAGRLRGPTCGSFHNRPLRSGVGARRSGLSSGAGIVGTSLLSRSVSAKSGVKPHVAAFFEPRTCSIQYVVADPVTLLCALIDPVLDYDEKSGSIGTGSADALLHYVS